MQMGGRGIGDLHNSEKLNNSQRLESLSCRVMKGFTIFFPLSVASFLLTLRTSLHYLPSPSLLMPYLLPYQAFSLPKSSSFFTFSCSCLFLLSFFPLLASFLFLFFLSPILCLSVCQSVSHFLSVCLSVCLSAIILCLFSSFS